MNLFKFAVVCMAVTLMLGGCGRSVVAENHQLSLRLANSTPTIGMQKVTLFGNGETAYLDSTDIVTAEDFEDIAVAFDENKRPCIHLVVTDVAGAKLHKLTTENRGKLMAILVNDEPGVAVQIVGPFRKEFRITGNWTEAEAVKVRNLLTGYLQ